MPAASERTVAVLGAGNMGTALAHQIAGNGHCVRAWSIEEDVLAEIRDHHRNSKYLEGVDLHPNVLASDEMGGSVAGADLIIVSVPSQVVPRLAADLTPHVRPGQPVLNVAKGLFDGKRMTEVIAAALGDPMQDYTGGLGGPAIAGELARDIPTAIVAAFPDGQTCRTVQGIIQNDSLKVEITTDLVGLELCATMKNVYAMALGMCDGLGYGTNTKAFLMNIAVHEMAGICEELGGRRETVFGLAGAADLLTTGFNKASRNRTFGEMMASGADWKAFAESHTVEGINACDAVKRLTYSHGLNTHLLDTIHEVLFLERAPDESIRHFFAEFAY